MNTQIQGQIPDPVFFLFLLMLLFQEVFQFFTSTSWKMRHFFFTLLFDLRCEGIFCNISCRVRLLLRALTCYVWTNPHRNVPELNATCEYSCLSPFCVCVQDLLTQWGCTPLGRRWLCSWWADMFFPRLYITKTHPVRHWSAKRRLMLLLVAEEHQHCFLATIIT